MLDLLRRLTLAGFVLINTRDYPQLRVLIAICTTLLFVVLQALGLILSPLNPLPFILLPPLPPKTSSSPRDLPQSR